jgi:hypothetical protein
MKLGTRHVGTRKYHLLQRYKVEEDPLQNVVVSKTANILSKNDNPLHFCHSERGIVVPPLHYESFDSLLIGHSLFVG